MPPPPVTPVGQALGRLPTGLYIVTTVDAGRPVGFVGSFVMQVGLQPPVLSVAVGKERGPLAALRANGHFAVSILDKASESVMGRFFRKYELGASPFDGLALETSPAGLPLPSEALAWVECKIRGEFEGGDHVIVFGDAIGGAQRRDGEPSIHLRKNGLGY
jgi:3-hydroxy-9,10-secoandrosta-1,3,5(10)-triene-9,17-dione monooxygenase reductase component